MSEIVEVPVLDATRRTPPTTAFYGDGGSNAA